MITDDAAFLGLQFDQGGKASLEIGVRHCTPFGFLYGGSGAAACCAAAEAATGRPLVWITTQYIGQANPGERLDLDVELMVTGRATTQALVRAHVGDRLVLHATTAHTDRPVGDEAWWGRMPAVPGPDEMDAFAPPFETPEGDSFARLIERRVEHGWAERHDGHIWMWTRVPDWGVGTAASQAFVADIVPMAVTNALGTVPGATSLDNTLRVVHGEPYDGWVLLDIEAQGFRRSVGHGQVRLWRPDGVLLGIGSQTCIVRTSHHKR